MKKKVSALSFSVFLLIVTAFILLPLRTTFARDSEGIALEKDVFLGWPIESVEDLPDEVTFALYDSETSSVPLATQTFARGKYTLDFEFNKSDGLASGSVARFKGDFTNKLDVGDDPDNPARVKEIWSEIEINGEITGDRTQVSNEILVQLLLASDGSISSYSPQPSPFLSWGCWSPVSYLPADSYIPYCTPTNCTKRVIPPYPT